LQTTSNDNEPPVRFDNVSKRYHLREGTTLKEFVQGVLLRKDTGSFYALRDINFQLERGQTLGIIGRNGSGKSTLLKMIAGVTIATQGEVYVNGRVSPLIELGAGFHPDLTGRENIFLNSAILGMPHKMVLERWDDIINFAELYDFMDTPVKHYSSGMYLRLAFSLAAHSDPDVLVIDEALAVGDVAFQERCMERIRQFQRDGVSIVIVSHGLGMIRDFCHRVIELDHGRIITDGDPAEVTSLYVHHSHTTAYADNVPVEVPKGAIDFPAAGEETPTAKEAPTAQGTSVSNDTSAETQALVDAEALTDEVAPNAETPVNEPAAPDAVVQAEGADNVETPTNAKARAR
jgi:ABC-type polysaccharide/polyol phosphate transport system ATPase subunit